MDMRLLTGIVDSCHSWGDCCADKIAFCGDNVEPSGSGMYHSKLLFGIYIYHPSILGCDSFHKKTGLTLHHPVYGSDICHPNPGSGITIQTLGLNFPYNVECNL